MCHFVKVLLPPKTRKTHLPLTLVIVRQSCLVTKTRLVWRRRISWALLSFNLPPTSSVSPSLNPPALFIACCRPPPRGSTSRVTSSETRCTVSVVPSVGYREQEAGTKLTLTGCECYVTEISSCFHPAGDARRVQLISLSPPRCSFLHLTLSLDTP